MEQFITFKQSPLSYKVMGTLNINGIGALPIPVLRELIEPPQLWVDAWYEGYIEMGQS